MKNTRPQGRRPMPKMRSKAKGVTVRREVTLGELICAAYDTLGDERAAMRVLRSRMLSERIGRKLVFL